MVRSLHRLVVAGALAAAAVLFSAAPASAVSHAAITITSDANFLSCGCVTGGSGTAADPYIIGPWDVPSPARGGWALKVDNSKGQVTKFFNVAGINAMFDDTNASDNLVWLVDVTNQTKIADVTGNNDGTGVRLDSVSNISLDGIAVNKLNGEGVLANSSSNLSIVNSKLKAFGNGFHAENSSLIKIGVGCTTSCNDFTYDDGRGLWLHNTHDVTVRYLTTSAEDTTAMYLDGTGTYNVDIGNSTANASGSICEAGHVGATGLVVDTDGGIRLVNGTHDNYIHDVTARGNVAQDIASGGDGFWLNPCTGVRQPISPATAPMGSGNVFANLCYAITNIVDLPPATTCK